MEHKNGNLTLAHDRRQIENLHRTAAPTESQFSDLAVAATALSLFGDQARPELILLWFPLSLLMKKLQNRIISLDRAPTEKESVPSR